VAINPTQSPLEALLIAAVYPGFEFVLLKYQPIRHLLAKQDEIS
jgi:hypothetical protein